MSLLRRLPGLLRDALLYELAIYRALARWAARRPDVPARATPIGYGQLVGPMLWLWILGSAAEVVVVEVVLRAVDQPWAEALRLPLLVLGIWGVAWMLGMLASYRVRPHLLDDATLLVRSGPVTWLRVPPAEVRSVRPVEHDLPGVIGRSTSRTSSPWSGWAAAPTSAGASSRPCCRRRAVRSSADRVGLWVDDPRETAALLRSRTTAPR